MSYPGLPSLPQGVALSPTTDARALFELAQENPAMWQAIAEHPNAYPGLLDWLEKVGPAQVKATVLARKAAAATFRAAPRPAGPAPLPATGAVPLPGGRPAPLPPAGAAPLPGSRSAPLPPTGAAPLPGGGNVAAPHVKGVPGRDGRLPSAERGPQQNPDRSFQKVGPAPVRTQAPAVSPVTPQAPVAMPEAGAQAFAPDDKTVLAKRHRKPRTLATLTWGDADPVPITQPRVLLGRKVGPKDAEEGLQIVQIKEPSKTVSGRHARLEFEDGKWYVQDLNSTNGIYLVLADGDEQRVTERSALVRDFYLGDVLCQVEAID